MTGTPAILLSLLMLAGLILAIGGVYRLTKYRDRQRGVLMLVASAVMFGNVAIIAWPM